jgi:hypothetical protein
VLLLGSKHRAPKKAENFEEIDKKYNFVPFFLETSTCLCVLIS